MPEVSKKLLEMLNTAIAREIQVSVQYMWQHVQWKGAKHFAVKDEFKHIAVVEMKHAESIAERLTYLGGTPTTKSEPVVVGDNLKQMLVNDAKDEEAAIRMYNQIIELASKEGDQVTADLFTKILSDEEEHHDFFTSVLEEL